MSCQSIKAQSRIEQAIRNSLTVVQSSESASIAVEFAGQQQRGIHLNRDEEASWNGSVPLSSYQINNDMNPEVIHKQNQNVEYVQEVAVKCLLPPPIQPGPITITKQPDTRVEPAPSIVLRQPAVNPPTPAPLHEVERPPKPEPIAPINITIPGKKLAPPKRRVVLEQLAPQPQKPQNITIERWAPYQYADRQVIFKDSPPLAPYCPQKNLLIKWQSGKANVTRNVRYAGCERANPEEYVARHGSAMKEPSHFEKYNLGFKCAEKCNVQGNRLPKLIGDVRALALVDLEQYGLSAYRSQLGGASAGAVADFASATASSGFVSSSFTESSSGFY